MAQAQFIFDAVNRLYTCRGSWSIMALNDVLHQMNTSAWPCDQNIVVSGQSIERLDSAGALLLVQCVAHLKQHNNIIELRDFTPHQRDLMHVIEEKQGCVDYVTVEAPPHSVAYQIGVETVGKYNQVLGFVALIGDFSHKLWEAVRQPRRFQAPSMISIIASAGVNALPIVGLLSFLIGVVLAYQMGLQLETYGANIYIAFLSGMAVFREFGPLITAIIVAGRTSSAFTAQISSMKINEEIDALYTMGLSPTELLVMPKVLGLLIALPLLCFWADIFGIIGAMLMSKLMLHVGYTDFLEHLQESVGSKHLLLGLYKAPAFAILIALVGCFQGFQVDSNADSVGRQTTRSVVQALFLIIVTDAIYSLIYSWMDL